MSFQASDGNILPGNGTSVRDRIAGAFRKAMSSARSPAKELARALGRTPKGAELILRGDNSPNLEALVLACRHYDEVWEEFKELCGRGGTASDAEAILAEFAQKLKERRIA
jgi:hypothetical protein